MISGTSGVGTPGGYQFGPHFGPIWVPFGGGIFGALFLCMLPFWVFFCLVHSCSCVFYTLDCIHSRGYPSLGGTTPYIYIRARVVGFTAEFCVPVTPFFNMAYSMDSGAKYMSKIRCYFNHRQISYMGHRLDTPYYCFSASTATSARVYICIGI